MEDAIHGLIGERNTVVQLIDLLKDEIREVRERIDQLKCVKEKMDNAEHNERRSAKSTDTGR
jgi:hypothetical protein